MKSNAQLLLALIWVACPMFAQEKPATTPGSETLPPQSDTEDTNIIQGKGTFGKLSNGASVSDTKKQTRIVEQVRPERVQVYPDDPGSAWWEINPHYAFLRAGREQKPLLLLFTSDQSTLAMKLSEQVFSTKSFNEYVKDNLVICYLNYPKNITDAPDSMRVWKKKFNVKGYPNVLIFNPDGEVDGHITGYRSDRPVDYFNDLKVKVQPVLNEIALKKEKWAQYGYRDWKGGKNDSVSIFAKFLRRDPDLVTLQGVKGERWTIAIDRLAEEDRILAKSFPALGEVVGVK